MYLSLQLSCSQEFFHNSFSRNNSLKASFTLHSILFFCIISLQPNSLNVTSKNFENKVRKVEQVKIMAHSLVLISQIGFWLLYSLSFIVNDKENNQSKMCPCVKILISIFCSYLTTLYFQTVTFLSVFSSSSQKLSWQD